MTETGLRKCVISRNHALAHSAAVYVCGVRVHLDGSAARRQDHALRLFFFLNLNPTHTS